MASEPSAQTWTVLKLLEWTRGYFDKAGVPSGRLAGEMLLAHVLGCKRIELYTRFDYTPTQAELAAYRELVRQAADHEPVAYLIGDKEFYSLSFRVTPDTLVPRPETEMLVDLALGFLTPLGAAATMWDVGTGCGCIAIATAAHAPHLTVLATDVSEAAVAVAADNADRHGLADRVRCRAASLLDRPADCADLGEMDLIAANLPYVRDDEDVAECVLREPAVALRGGPDGLALLGPMVAAAPTQLRVGGMLLIEFGTDQADDVCELIDATGSFDEPDVLADRQNLERIASAVRIR